MSEIADQIAANLATIEELQRQVEQLKNSPMKQAMERLNELEIQRKTALQVLIKADTWLIEALDVSSWVDGPTVAQYFDDISKALGISLRGTE